MKLEDENFPAYVYNHVQELKQWFSTFLTLWPFNTVPRVVETPNHKTISLLFHDCNYATVMNRKVNI